MRELESHVEKLFKGYRNTEEVKDLKEEILTNLEAKAGDHIKSGMAYEDAINMTIKSIDSVDHLINRNQKIYINRYKAEVFQSLLLYLLIAWIVTIPLRFMRSGITSNTFLTAAVIALAIIYFLACLKKDKAYLDKVSDFDIKRLAIYRRWAWIIWCIYLAVMMVYATGVHFASNIWFHRAVRINGPYQFAAIAVDYLLPFILIVVPLVFNRAYTLAAKYGVGEQL